jgi:hypothetical protein
VYRPNERPRSLNIIQSVNATGVEITSKSCLIMDEVDGMSAGDRGGVGALAALIKKTRVCLPQLNPQSSRADVEL